MKRLVLGALLVGAGWWHLEGGRNLDNAAVRDFYDLQTQATVDHDSDFLCSRLVDDYELREVRFSTAGHQKVQLSKDQACEQFLASFKAMRALSDLTGGRMQVSLVNRIDSISISDDEETATVEGEGRVILAGHLMAKVQYREELIRRNGRVLLARSESKSWDYAPRR